MSAAQHESPHPQATCAVRGLVLPGAMCAKVIVGGIHCGHDGPCRHKIETAIKATVPGMFDDDNAALMKESDVKAMGGAS